VGLEGIEKLLKETIETAKRKRYFEDQSLGAGQCGYDAAGEGGGVSGGCAVVSQDVAELEQVPQYIRGQKEAE